MVADANRPRLRRPVSRWLYETQRARVNELHLSSCNAHWLEHALIWMDTLLSTIHISGGAASSDSSFLSRRHLFGATPNRFRLDMERGELQQRREHVTSYDTRLASFSLSRVRPLDEHIFLLPDNVTLRPVFSCLRSLALTSAGLAQFPSAALAPLTTLRALDLSGNAFKLLSSECLAPFVQLEEFVCNEGALQAVVLAPPPRLVALSLANNDDTMTFEFASDAPCALTRLNVARRCAHDSRSPTDMARLLRACPQLAYLHARNVRVAPMSRASLAALLPVLPPLRILGGWFRSFENAGAAEWTADDFALLWARLGITLRELSVSFCSHACANAIKLHCTRLAKLSITVWPEDDASFVECAVARMPLEALQMTGFFSRELMQCAVWRHTLRTLVLEQHNISPVVAEGVCAPLTNLTALEIRRHSTPHRDEPCATLPIDLGALFSLTTCTLTGLNVERVPDSFSRLHHLRRLRVRTCTRLTSLDNVDFGCMTDLQDVAVMDCALSTLPPSLGACGATLRELDVRHNQLSALPLGYDQLTRCTRLDLSHNCFADISMGLMTSLQRLALAHNRQLCELPSVLSRMTQLHTVELQDTNMRCIPACLALSHLRLLNVSCCPELEDVSGTFLARVPTTCVVVLDQTPLIRNDALRRLLLYRHR